MKGNYPIMILEETAKHLRNRKIYFHKMARPVKYERLPHGSREGRIPIVKMELGKNDKNIIRIPYNQDLKKKVKSISGRKWNPKGKHGEVPYDENLISKLQNLFGENLISVDPYFYLIPLQKQLSRRKYSRGAV